MPKYRINKATHQPQSFEQRHSSALTPFLSSLGHFDRSQVNVTVSAGQRHGDIEMVPRPRQWLDQHRAGLVVHARESRQPASSPSLISSGWISFSSTGRGQTGSVTQHLRRQLAVDLDIRGDRFVPQGSCAVLALLIVNICLFFCTTPCSVFSINSIIYPPSSRRPPLGGGGSGGGEEGGGEGAAGLFRILHARGPIPNSALTRWEQRTVGGGGDYRISSGNWTGEFTAGKIAVWIPRLGLETDLNRLLFPFLEHPHSARARGFGRP